MARVMLGDPGRDVVTGYEGTVVKVMEIYLDDGQVCLERADAQGKPEQEWFPVGRVEYRT